MSESLMYLLLAVMVVTTFLQVFFRYVIFHSLPWSEELSRYALVWLTFIGASCGIKRGIHVAVEALTQALPPRARRLLCQLTCLLITFLGAVLIIYGLKLALVNLGQLSPSLHIPIGIIYLALPVGGLLMAVHALALLPAKEMEH
jgi:C4-dicarboxylate transporter DctQ subunit